MQDFKKNKKQKQAFIFSHYYKKNRKALKKKKIAVAYLRAKDGGKLQDGAGPYW